MTTKLRLHLLVAMAATFLSLSLVNKDAVAAMKGEITANAILSAQDKELLKEALRLQQTLGDQVWPGLGSAGIPIILFNDSYEFLFKATNPPSSWTMVKDDDFFGQQYYRRSAVEPQAFALPVGEEWAGSMSTLDWINRKSPLKLSRDFYVVLILHEVFHAFQAREAAALFNKALSVYALEGKYPAKDTAFKAAWDTEGSLLAAALKAQDAAEVLAKSFEFLKNRQMRRAQASLKEDLVDFERRLEWLEGLAKYAEIRFYELAANHSGDPAFAGYRRGLPYWTWDFVRLERQSGSQESDLRFYLSGMAQARILDRLYPGWKKRFFQDGMILEDALRVAK